MHRKIKFALMAGIAAMSIGCTTHIGSGPESKAGQYNKELEEWKKRSEEQRSNRVRITDMPAAGARIQIDRNRWLKDKRISIEMPKGGGSISAHALAQMLKSKGLNVMSSLPLDGYSYTGFGVHNVDGETALKLLFAPMQLDYVIDSENQFITIVPNKQRTFYIKLGPKKTRYVSGSVSGNVGSSYGGGGSSSSSSTSGLVSGVETGVDTGEGNVTIDQDFWSSLDKELTALLKQCVPTYNPATAQSMAGTDLPPLPAEMLAGGAANAKGYGSLPASSVARTTSTAKESANGGNNTLCSEQVLGNFSTNPTTGAVTVQAPHWVMEDVERYLKNVKADNAVTLVYEGMLIMVTTSKQNSEGLDLQAFATFAQGKYGMVVNNNALGGVTVSTPSTGNVPVATAGGDVLGSTLLGVQKLTGNPAQVFLAYLEENGNFSVKQRPRLATTNGVPAEFAQYDTQYYNQIQQSSSASSTGGALVGTSNQLVPFKVGSLLRIVPYYDAEEGSVRSPLTFSQSLQTGNFQTTQYITGADGEAQAVPSTIPQIRDSNYSGEVIMRDGDMIILGGQITETNESTGAGITGYNVENNPVSALMGRKNHRDEVATYYLALSLKVNK